MIREWYKNKKLAYGLKNKQLEACIKIADMQNRYIAGDRSKRSMEAMSLFGNDANSDIIPDLTTMRERSRYLQANDPIASSIFETKSVNVIGRGFTYRSQTDIPNLPEDWNKKKEREWNLFWNSRFFDFTYKLNGNAFLLQNYFLMNLNGESLVIVQNGKSNYIRPYGTQFQVIESDHLSNPDNMMDSEYIQGGIEKNDFGQVLKYHLTKFHPGAISRFGSNEWLSIDAWDNKTGLPNVIHFYKQKRPGQSRGVPDLHAVIEPLQTFSKYNEAELTRSVVNTLVGLVIETATGNLDFDTSYIDSKNSTNSGDLKLSPGMILGLKKGETAKSFDPKAPNSAYEAFFLASLKRIGMATSIPFELLLKHFSASYSASKAAILEFWKWVLQERQFIIDDFLSIINELFMYEAVATNRIIAPGYFSDPALRNEYNRVDFRGPGRGSINERDEVEGAIKRINANLSTRELEIAEMSGNDWEDIIKQSALEHNKLLENDLLQVENGNTEPIQGN